MPDAEFKPTLNASFPGREGLGAIADKFKASLLSTAVL
jgi:hypothetical protein